MRRISSGHLGLWVAVALLLSCSGKKEDPGVSARDRSGGVTHQPKVTFIELGSVRCIPCRMMQPIMREIEREYAGEVRVVFYDVWTPEGRPYAEKYRIRVIPTQVFLDAEGREFFRHEGFFPKEEIVKVLQRAGVK
jgi:thioredoxin 1